MTDAPTAAVGPDDRADALPPVTMFGPDFPFGYDDWLAHPAGIGRLPETAHGTPVAIIGGGIAGTVAAYELMRLGLKPIVYEGSRLGGRLRSVPFGGARDDGAGAAAAPDDEARETAGAADASSPESAVVAEMGGMRFPISSTTFFHYVDLLSLDSAPFPNPLTPASGSTVVDLEGETYYARTLDDLPPLFREVADAWDSALDRILHLGGLQGAIRARNTARLKEIWNAIVEAWDDRSFYEFVASSDEFARLSFRHREVFGQVGFGTGGWDSDFANSMLEILRVVVTNCDTDQRLIVGGAEQVPRGLWGLAVRGNVHWPDGTSVADLNGGEPRPSVTKLARTAAGTLAVTDESGETHEFEAVLATCQSWLLTTQIQTDETLFSQRMWMALDRTRYMQSSKTFVMVDRPFWKDVDPATGRDVMSMTLTDRLTRGTYLFDNGPDRPGVICLTYSWMSDALKMLPHPVERRVELALEALGHIYPGLDIRSHIVGDPITVSWEDDPHFLGAFKGALPGHYRYNRRMYGHFMQQDAPAAERGLFIAGDDVSFTPAWAEGAVQTSLNAVWGIMTHFGGASAPENPGPGDVFDELGPVALPD